MPGRPRDEEFDDSPSNAKKARYGPSKGAILKIRVHNFMTYGDAEICPGPRLNLVLGPNGTGKSSLVNAICLGLAGPTSLLGRADNVRDFVRRGETEGYVQIWLSTGDPTNPSVVIKRSLKATENSSEWRINGAASNMSNVREKVKQLNVQLDNLCQFLPQDKVVEFARLKPGQLLEETEKAIGDSTLYTLHQELIEERNQLKTFETAADAAQQELQVLERTNEGLKRDVHRFEQKAQLEKEIGALKEKLAWVKFKEIKKRYAEDVKKYDQTKQTLDAQHARMDDTTRPKREKEEKQQAADTKSKQTTKALRKLEDDIDKAKVELDGKLEEVEEKTTDLDNLEIEYAKWQEDIAKYKAEVEGVRADLAELQSQMTQSQAPDHTAEIQQLKRERRDKAETMHGLAHNLDEIRAEHHQRQTEVVAYHEALRTLADVKVQRLRHLESNHSGITALTKWLDQAGTKNMFKGSVYGPILCEVTVENPQHAAFLEQHCPRDLWLRFVTEFQEDQDLLARESQARFNYRPIVTNFNGNTNEAIRHRLGEAANFARYGITHTLDEVFVAPQTVKLVMCNDANLHETYCGTAKIDAETLIREQPQILRFMTPESSYQGRVSKYNPNSRSSNVSAMRPANLLSGATNSNYDQEKAELQHKVQQASQERNNLDGTAKDLERQVKAAEQEVQAIDKEIHRLTDVVNAARNRRGKLQATLKTKEKQLERAEAKPDPRNKEEAIRAEIEMCNQDMCRLIAKITDCYTELVDVQMQHTVAEATRCELTLQIRELERQQRTAVQELRRLENILNSFKENVEYEKGTMEKLKREAESLSGPWDDEVKARLAGLPDLPEQIEEAIAAKDSEIDAIQLANPRAMEDFNKRKKEIERLARSAQDQQESLDARKREIEAKKDRWLPELRRIVAKINAKFGRSFQRIGCAGEVKLWEEKDPVTGVEDFERFAIHINVKFRAEEEMQLLTAHRQSGGERSVSTILYLIAIQNVTVCPFRVVDEINQGMDPINERNVFRQLVEAACKPGTPQCFLLTPKLLPNLLFSEHVRILEIFNGQLVSDVSRDFKLEEIMGGRKELEPEA